MLGAASIKTCSKRSVRVDEEEWANMANTETGARIGDLAPDFELKDQNGQLWRLSDHRGKVVALIFYPKDQTTVCTKQMCSMRDRWSDYQASGAEVVAISVGSVQSHKEFAQYHKLPQRLLADESGGVTRRFNVKSLLGNFSQRAVIVIDPQGIIRYRKSVLPIFRPDDDEIIAAIYTAASAQ
jgi:peroxiredoxin Q/BCP